jgi:uncharacterized protein (DUF2141 family)
MARRSTLHTFVFALVAFALSSPATADEETASPPAVLKVDVTNIPNEKGQIGCSLYSKEDGFPSKPEKADAMMFVKAKAGKASCVFKGLKPGKYAVSVMHDEDKDGELKTSMVGRPKEWWGVSNNVPPERFGPPKYESALFSYSGNPKTIQVRLRI